MALLVVLVVQEVVERRVERKARREREAAWAAILVEIEAQTRSTRHSLKGLTAALNLEERVRALRAPVELDGDPPPE